jgi:hypothetical protein
VPFDSRWLRHLPKDEHEKFEQAVRHDTLVLGRLLAILEDELKSLERSEETEAQFDNPNWQYKIAYRSGLKSQLNKVMTLLNFIKE